MLVLSFDQDVGLLVDSRYYDLDIDSYCNLCEFSTTCKYLYYAKFRKYDKIFRVKVSDLDNGIYDNVEEFIIGDYINQAIKFSYIHIGIDGNIYLDSYPIVVIQNSDDETPDFKIVEGEITEPDLKFPNFLYTYDLFMCKGNCDRSVQFFYNDKHNEVVSCEWDFGDDEKSNEQNPIHKYLNSGVYNVSLNVTLSNGQNKTIPTRKIIVSDKKANSPKIIQD